MRYFFDYVFAKENKWLDGTHKKEQYDDDRQAFVRYIEIQRNGKKAEADLKKDGMLPEGTRFLCTVDIFYNGEYSLPASFEFVRRAFNVLNEGYKQQLQSNSSEPQ